MPLAAMAMYIYKLGSLKVISALRGCNVAPVPRLYGLVDIRYTILAIERDL